MRTTVTLDPDVTAFVETERAQTGESFKQVINRLLRRAARGHDAVGVSLPTLPGRPALDVTDVSALMSTIDDERRAQRNIP